MQQRGERRPLLMVFDSREGYYLELTTLCSYLLIGICLYLIQMGMVAPWSGQTLSIDPYKDGKGHHSIPFARAAWVRSSKGLCGSTHVDKQARRLASGASA